MAKYILYVSRKRCDFFVGFEKKVADCVYVTHVCVKIDEYYGWSNVLDAYLTSIYEY